MGRFEVVDKMKKFAVYRIQLRPTSGVITLNIHHYKMRLMGGRLRQSVAALALPFL